MGRLGWAGWRSVVDICGCGGAHTPAGTVSRTTETNYVKLTDVYISSLL